MVKFFIIYTHKKGNDFFMKDYSLNSKDREDFILGYDVTEDGMINIKFANGVLWPIPYNKESEKKVLDKMEEQLANPDDIETKLHNRLYALSAISIGLFFGIIISQLYIWDKALTIETVQALNILYSIGYGTSLISGILAIKTKNKFKDFRKNIKFINEMKEKLNEAVRSNENALVNVSKKTRNVIADTPKDREVFNINSFNYVPFSDLEQIMENVARNERFRFDYTNQEEPPQAIVRKRVR